jgi:ATP-dependent Clp protease ATP-binding subunit ClpB
VLDDGRLTDGKGRVVDFKNVVVIMTSNVGSHLIQELQGVDEKELKARIETELRAHFRPEFLNRIDDIVTFRRLELADIEKIVEIQLRKVAELVAPRGIKLTWETPVATWLAREAYDPVYGARPLKRNIQKLVQDPLAWKLLAGEVREGSPVAIALAPGGAALEFRTEPALAPSRKER